MKTQLTKEQSQHLIELGFPKWKVQETKPSDVSLKEWIPTITLTDLLEILPKEIGHHSCISIDWNFITEEWDVDYDCTQSSWRVAKELIDSLYELCVWTLEQGHLKFE